MAPASSFDITSPIDFHEVDNALNQARKEVAQRYDFKGAKADIELSDGRVTSLAGLFTLTRTRPSSPLPEQLGCALEDGPMGPFIRTDGTAQTTVPGIFAAGDAARAVGSVAFAVAGGALAGAGTHRSLMFGLG